MRTAALALGILAATAYTMDVQADDKKVCGDAYAASQSLRDEHRLLAARDQLRLCARQSCAPFAGGQIVKDCTSWLAQVEPVIPSLVFEAKDASGNDLSAVQVTIDGQPLADKLDGSALQVDPGEHRFAFDGAGAHADRTIVVHEGDKSRQVRVVLGKSSAASQGATPPPVPDAPADGSTQRTIGFVVGGIGVAGLVVGSIFGAMALSGSPCDSSSKTCASQADHDTLAAHETIANVGLGVGIVAIAVGGYLLLTAHGDDSTRASASIAPWIGWGSAGLTGRFQ